MSHRHPKHPDKSRLGDSGTKGREGASPVAPPAPHSSLCSVPLGLRLTTPSRHLSDTANITTAGRQVPDQEPCNLPADAPQPRSRSWRLCAAPQPPDWWRLGAPGLLPSRVAKIDNPPQSRQQGPSSTASGAPEQIYLPRSWHGEPIFSTPILYFLFPPKKCRLPHPGFCSAPSASTSFSASCWVSPSKTAL